MPIPRNKSTQNFSTIPTLNQNLNSRAPRRNKSSTNLSSNNLIQPLSSNTSKPRTLVSQPSKSSLKKSNHQLNKSNHQLNNQQLNSYESAPPWMKAAMKKRQLDRSAKNILESKSTGEISDVFSDANKAKLAGFYTTNCHSFRARREEEIDLRVKIEMDTPWGKVRKAVLKFCPRLVRNRYMFHHEYNKSKQRQIPNFYPREYYTSMKYNAKWSDKLLVKAELKRLWTEDCDDWESLVENMRNSD